jgi:hypothetical protein
MIEVLDCEQGSADWFQSRLGIPTASRFKDVLAKGQGKTRRRYLLDLAGELLTGVPTESYFGRDMERGVIMESEARDLYTFMADVECQPVGFIRSGMKGCSPDSLVEANGMLEIKTKLPALQIECILEDAVPSEHVAQLQGALWVAEREWIDFVSYWPRLPLFVKRVYRDEEYIKTLAMEIDRFNNELREMVEKLQPTQSKEKAA